MPNEYWNLKIIHPGYDVEEYTDIFPVTSDGGILYPEQRRATFGMISGEVDGETMYAIKTIQYGANDTAILDSDLYSKEELENILGDNR